MESVKIMQYTSAGDIRNLLDNKHIRTWGFHVYRCTYKDDKKWSQFLKRMNDDIHKYLARRNDLDLLKTMDMRYHDNKSTLDGLNVDQVRKDFWNWLDSEDCKSEWDGLRISEPMGARYIFCVYIGEDELESIVGKIPEGQKRSHPYVTLIDSWWGRPIPEEQRSVDEPEEFTGGTELEDMWPGSAKTSLIGLVPDEYEALHDHTLWYNMAMDPNEVNGEPFYGWKKGLGDPPPRNEYDLKGEWV
jgi:hypothetical protein